MDKKELAKLRAANVLLDIMNNHKERIAELAAAKEQREWQSKEMTREVAKSDLSLFLFTFMTLIYSQPCDIIIKTAICMEDKSENEASLYVYSSQYFNAS